MLIFVCIVYEALLRAAIIKEYLICFYWLKRERFNFVPGLMNILGHFFKTWNVVQVCYVYFFTSFDTFLKQDSLFSLERCVSACDFVLLWMRSSGIMGCFLLHAVRHLVPKWMREPLSLHTHTYTHNQNVRTSCCSQCAYQQTSAHITESQCIRYCGVFKVDDVKQCQG